MARDTLIGSRIRERRMLAGLRQADLARRAGISASYLNLIEHNRRRIGGKLLVRIAEALEVEPSLLSEGAEAALLARLREAAAVQPGNRAEVDRAEEFAGRFPGWAELLADARRRIDALEDTVETLTDRLAHDPHLAASLHEVLSTVTAIRSTAAILAGTEELEREWQDRFHRNLDEDSRRLAEGAQALVTYLDSAADARRSLTSPQEEIEAFLAARDFHFPELEAAGGEPDALLDPEALTSEAARQIAARLLRRYAQDARAIPLDLAASVVADHGADPAALAEAAGTDLPCAMRRLAALPSALLPAPAGLAICDGAGALTFRKPLDDFPLPRFGGGCALWPLFEALARPGQPVARDLVQAGGEARPVRAYAVAAPARPAAFDGPPLMEAHMLVVPADREEDRARPPLAVGVTCRICPLEGCAARREPSILAAGF
ncbi:transcriptional regulator [Rhodosalinus halophilus]|uniref:Transcriptional regulator n=1 Tax=Rhodosalinus halophilus TaxID=2259333 RepID=A0A365U466_9RHOB|nr:XRE family transcriptional regulator [Rhodosalinus halophilus]RBI82889.1 transcriptional regulator [Rhodosalinus halophilus]